MNFSNVSASVTKTGELLLRYDRLNCYFSYCFFSPVHYKDLPVTPVRFSSPVYYKDLPVTLAILLCLKIVTLTFVLSAYWPVLISVYHQ